MNIRVENLTKEYGTQKALNNVSIEIKGNGVVGLLGPNGAGKSTLMKIMTCYITPTSGNVYIDKMSVLQDSVSIRKRIGYLPESNPLYYDMYVIEFLRFIADIHKIKDKDKIIDKIINDTGLGVEKHKKIGELSKGYKQRVGIAQAIIHNPDLLILDEPTSGLDPNQLVDIRNLIIKLGKTKTVILSTHIMQEVEAMCERVIIINKGSIVADDSLRHLESNNGGNLENIFRKLTK